MASTIKRPTSTIRDFLPSIRKTAAGITVTTRKNREYAATAESPDHNAPDQSVDCRSQPTQPHRQVARGGQSIDHRPGTHGGALLIGVKPPYILAAMFLHVPRQAHLAQRTQLTGPNRSRRHRNEAAIQRRSIPPPQPSAPEHPEEPERVFNRNWAIVPPRKAATN